jgi:heat shock protein HtpX
MAATATLGLTTYRQSNNIKSIALLAAFPVLLLALVGAIFFLFGFVATSGGQDPYAPGPLQMFGLTPVLGSGSPADLALSAMVAYWPIVFGVAAVWVLIGYFFNDSIIHMATGAVPVTREAAPQLYNLLENLCISRGLTMPKLYIIDTDVMNAYASGIDTKSYAITVTRGLLGQLSPSELEAVLAHELTHIIDRDTRLLIVTVVFVGMISFVAQLLWRGLRIASFGRVRSRNGGAAVLILVVISAVVMFIGYLLALVLRFAISRRRELLADAGSVELTKNPDALISALLKISKNAEVPHVPSEVRQMFIENPPSAFDVGGLFATHPPIAKRIQILEELGGHPPAEPQSAAGPWGKAT